MALAEPIAHRLARMNAQQLRELDALLLSPDVFRRTYRHDPAAFAVDCVDWSPDPGPALYQLEILSQIPLKHRVAVRAPHGAGKTCIAALAILWFALTREPDDWKVPITASAWRQLSKFALPEVHKWARRLRWGKIGRPPFDMKSELLDLSLKLAHGEAFALASDTPSSLEGAHAGAILVAFDEARAIPATTWDALEGALLTGDAYALAISTPGAPNGRFYEIHARKPGYEDWWTRHITLEEAIAAGRIPREKAEQRALQWGRGSSVYQNRVLGEFAADAEDSVIPLAWIELANERWRAWHDAGALGTKLTAVGVDVARSAPAEGEEENLDRAKTVLALRFESTIRELRRYQVADTMIVTGHVAGVLRAGGGIAVVDVVGVGGGPVDRLREQGCAVIAFNAGVRCDLRDRSLELGFVNIRSAAWWHLRELLDPANEESIALPPDDLLTGDLTAPKWSVASIGKIQVEGKPEIAKRIGRSTDDGDAVVMAFALELLHNPSTQVTRSEMAALQSFTSSHGDIRIPDELRHEFGMDDEEGNGFHG